MSDKFTDILSEVKKIKRSVTVFLPSQNKNIELTPLSLLQQKSIIESTISNTVSLINFNTNLYKIFLENLPANTTVNTIDRVNLVLALRHSMHDTFTVDSKNISIKDVLIKNTKITSIESEKIIKGSNFIFTLKIPSLDRDNRVNQHLLKHHKEDEEDIKTLVSDLYVGEIAKFVSSIRIISNDKNIDISTLSIGDTFQLLESIDSSEYADIIKYITYVREIEKELTRIPDCDLFIDIVPDLFII